MQSFEMTSQAALRIRPRERRGDRTRARLVEAALAEFRQHGFERASIARIAKGAGVSRPTFYFHFPAKEDLLRELLEALELEVAERIGRMRTLREGVDELIRSILDVQGQVGATVFAEMLRVQTREAGAERERPDAVREALAPLFVAGAERGELRAGLDPERSATIYLASMFGCLLTPAGDGDEGHAEDLRALSALFFRDAAAEPLRPRTGSTP